MKSLQNYAKYAIVLIIIAILVIAVITIIHVPAEQSNNTDDIGKTPEIPTPEETSDAGSQEIIFSCQLEEIEESKALNMTIVPFDEKLCINYPEIVEGMEKVDESTSKWFKGGRLIAWVDLTEYPFDDFYDACINANPSNDCISSPFLFEYKDHYFRIICMPIPFEPPPPVK